MRVNPKDALKKSYLKSKIKKSVLDNFKMEYYKLKDSINSNESEEHNKIIIKDFLNAIGYTGEYKINTSGRVDLAIYKNSIPEVLIEAKSPKNKTEMISAKDLNKKALGESILYYLRETEIEKNYKVRHIIITNGFEWFIFDAADFDKLATDKAIIDRFIEFTRRTSSKTKTEDFYRFIEEYFQQRPEILKATKFTHFSLKDNYSDKELEYLYKLLSPQASIETIHCR